MQNLAKIMLHNRQLHTNPGLNSVEFNSRHSPVKHQLITCEMLNMAKESNVLQFSDFLSGNHATNSAKN